MRINLRATLVALLFSASLITGMVEAEPLAPFEIQVENVASARLGDEVQVSISQLSGTEIYANFHLLIAFDPDVLSLVSAEEGFVPGVCQWDSFEYNLLPCTGCAWQLVEFTGVADDPGIPGVPACYSAAGDLVVMTFKLLPDTLNAGDFAEISFYWDDCESNTSGSIVADTTWYGKFAYDYLGNDITGLDPNFGSTQSGCIVPNGDTPIRAINTHNGGIQILEDYGVYGDLNGDGRFNISDLTYMVNYIFANGNAPKDYLRGDYDGDGSVTIGDAVFLLNYLFGPFPR
jgi:hypothetical protein